MYLHNSDNTHFGLSHCKYCKIFNIKRCMHFYCHCLLNFKLLIIKQLFLGGLLMTKKNQCEIIFKKTCSLFLWKLKIPLVRDNISLRVLKLGNRIFGLIYFFPFVMSHKHKKLHDIRYFYQVGIGSIIGRT